MTAIALRLIAFACIAAALPCVQAASPAAQRGSPVAAHADAHQDAHRAAHPGAGGAHGAHAAHAAAGASAAEPVVRAEGAWARATVAGQSSSAAYMVLTASAAQTLVAVEAEVAGLAEVHEMALQGDVMRMRPLPNGLPLPAGQAVALQPGGLHLMLMKLKRPLQAGEVLPLTLTFKGADGQLRRQSVPVTVQRSAPGAAGSAGHGSGHGHGH